MTTKGKTLLDNFTQHPTEDSMWELLFYIRDYRDRPCFVTTDSYILSLRYKCDDCPLSKIRLSKDKDVCDAASQGTRYYLNEESRINWEDHGSIILLAMIQFKLWIDTFLEANHA